MFLPFGLFAQMYDFNTKDLAKYNISRVLEFEEIHKGPNTKDNIIEIRCTYDVCIDSVGNQIDFNRLQRSSIYRNLHSNADTVYYGTKPQVVLTDHGNVFWYYYSTLRVSEFDTVSGTYDHKIITGFPDSIIVRNPEQSVTTYRYKYKYNLYQLSTERKALVGNWYFCYKFENQYQPTEVGDTIILRRTKEQDPISSKCTDLHYLSLNMDMSLEYSSDTSKISGLPYPKNYNNWIYNDRGLYFSFKNGLPAEQWKVKFIDLNKLMLIYEPEDSNY
jgi:hypothetical protein